MATTNNAVINRRLIKAGKGRLKLSLAQVVSMIALAVVSLIFLYPLIWMLDSSFRPPIEIFNIPPVIFQKPIWVSVQSYSWANYIKAFIGYSIGQSFFNSILVTASSILLTIIVTSLAAYAFSYLRFPLKNFWFYFILGTMMLPTGTMIAPYYKVLRSLHLLNTLYALIIPSAMSAFAVFMLRQFFIKIPYSFIESARMDGASHFQIWRKIILPLAMPAVAAVSIFQFRGVWNDFLMPQIVLNNERLFTIPVKIKLMDGINLNKPYDAMMATGFLFSLIPIIVFLIFQRQFIEGLTGGVKR